VLDSLRLYDWITFLYAVSVLLYFVDFVQKNRKVNRYAYWSLVGVWVLQTIFFIERMRALDYVPVFTRFEVTIFFAWLLITFSLIINYFYKMDMFTFLVNILGFSFVAFDSFERKGATYLATQLQGDLLVIHIGMAIVSYALFSLACIVSIMYLIQHYMLKMKRWKPILNRLPALDRLESVTFIMILIGFPLLLIAMILGAIWYKLHFGNILWFDAKPLVSAILLVIYGIYLYVRVSSGWGGQKLAWLSILGFIVVVINYLVVSQFMSGFHRWG
jgi:HemX protein